MKNLLFILLGVVGIVLLALGNKKDAFIIKFWGIFLIITFVTMIISIFL